MKGRYKTMDYNRRKTYYKNGKTWDMTDIRKDKAFIERMLACDLYYHYIAKSPYIKRISSNGYTLTVLYDNGYKAVYEK